MRFDSTAYLHYGDMEYVRRWDRMILEFREQAALCDAIGMTTFWFPEHHFGAIDGWNDSTPNPVLICMDVAARTRKLRLGTPDYVSERIEALRQRFRCKHLA